MCVCVPNYIFFGKKKKHTQKKTPNILSQVNRLHQASTLIFPSFLYLQ